MKRRFLLLFKTQQLSFCYRPGLRSWHTLLLLSSVTLFHLISLSCVWCVRHDHHKTTHLEAKVGSYVVFNCYIDFPYDLPIPYVVHWSKDLLLQVKEKSTFGEIPGATARKYK
uniref:Uncharacterized protein n=1 Tax=Glossina pallidipes TaxID=7398 RepID=A0A1A9ZJ19_GLOPL